MKPIYLRRREKGEGEDKKEDVKSEVKEEEGDRGGASEGGGESLFKKRSFSGNRRGRK